MTELEKQYKWQKEAVERRQKEVNDMYDRLNSLLSAIAARSAEVKGQVEIAQDWLKELKYEEQKLGEYKVGLGEYAGVMVYGAEQFEEDYKNEPDWRTETFRLIDEANKKNGNESTDKG